MRRGPRRYADAVRCERCRMLRALCICGFIPRLQTRTHVVLVLHQLELVKPTNTGRLAMTCLPNSSVVVRGAGGPAERNVTWPADTDPVLLFPHEDAQPLEAWRGHPRPVSLIVPDGTWSQAIKIRRRMRGLENVPVARLPDGLTTTYRLRKASGAGQVSTLEAIAYALGILEGSHAETALALIHRIMVERTLWSRARLAAAEVTGGIPPEAMS